MHSRDDVTAITDKLIDTVGFNHVSAVGRAVPMHTGESYDGPGPALVPTIRIEDFLMTSVSPAI